MHLNPPASHGPPSSAASSRPTTRPSSGRSATSRSSTAHAAAAGGGAEAAAVASVQLRPSTVWLSLPLLQRLQSFFEPLANLPAAVTANNRCAMLWCICQPVQCVLLAVPGTAHTPGSHVRGQCGHICLRCFNMLHICLVKSSCRVALVKYTVKYERVLVMEQMALYLSISICMVNTTSAGILLMSLSLRPLCQNT